MLRRLSYDNPTKIFKDVPEREASLKKRQVCDIQTPFTTKQLDK